MSGSDWLAVVVTVGGAALFALGVVGLVAGDDTDESEPVVAADAPATSITATTVEPAPSSIPTSTSTTESTPPIASTTTGELPVPAETVEDFIGAFDAALGDGDLDFLYDRLHPVTLELGGAEACRAYVDTEFAAATALALTGTVTGPELVTKSAPAGPIEVPDRYTAEVALTFQGQVFDLVAEYALFDGEMRWLTNCS